MDLSPAQFDIPAEFHISEFLAQLQSQFKLIEITPLTVKLSFCDTFDWRIFSSGLQLEHEVANNAHTYLLRQNDSGQIITSLQARKSLKFIWDFPESSIKTQLTPIIEMRALLPMVRLRCKRREFHVLNNNDKTVLRVRIETGRLLKTEDTHGIQLVKRIIIEPIKGYKKPYDKVLSILRDDLTFPLSYDNLYTKALLAIQKQPGSYSSKLTIALDPAMRADSATKIILLHLFDTMQINEAGTANDIDSEFLHDFRVAVRRTRSALSQIKQVLPQATVKQYQKEFGWLGAVTNRTRDLDVYLLQFPEYKNSVPEDLRDALDLLHDFLQKQKSLEQKTLAKALHSTRYQKLSRQWRKLLTSPAPKRTTLKYAGEPVINVANQRIWRMYKRVVNEGNAIDNESPPQDLHELRISCKKLRYLIEFFYSLYPLEKITTLIKALKQLQTNLGDYNDLHVQIESLKHFSEQMLTEQQAPAETLLAMGTLIEQLDQKQHTVRQEFYARFRQFTASEYVAVFEELFTTTIKEPQILEK